MVKKQSPCCGPLKLQYKPFNYMSDKDIAEVWGHVLCIFLGI